METPTTECDGPRPRRGIGWATHAARVALLGIYLAALHSMPTSVFWHPDEGAKYLAMLSLRWDDGLQYVMPYGGRAIDPQLDYYASRCTPSFLYPSLDAHGALQHRWPIWFPLLSRPFYGAFGLAGLYIIPLLCGWMIAVFAGRWAAWYDRALVPIATLLVGCATPMLFYSLNFSEHTLATLCGVLALSAFASDRQPRWLRGVAVVLAVTAATMLRAEMLAFAVAIALCAVLVSLGERPGTAHAGAVSRGDLLSAPKVLAVLVVVGCVATALAFAVLPPRHRELVASLPSLLALNVRKLEYLPRSVVSIFAGSPDEGFPGGLAGRVAIFLAIAAAVCGPFVRQPTGWALVLGAVFVFVECSLFMALAGRPYLSRQGVLSVAPFMIAVPAAVAYLRGRAEPQLRRLVGVGLSYAVVGFFVLFVSRVTVLGDFPIGRDGAARYMLTLYPVGAVLALVAAQMVRRSAIPALIRSGFMILVTAGVVIAAYYQHRGIQEMRANKAMLLQWEAALRRHEHVLTDVWWLPASLAPFYATHEIYCVGELGDLPTWIARAASRGVASFAIATTDWVVIPPNVPSPRRIVPQGCETVAGLQVCGVAIPPGNDESPLPP